jgi:hypothetical protein
MKEMPTDAGGEWCGPTRELENGQLASLVHKSRKVVTEKVESDVAIETSDEEVVLLVNKPPLGATSMVMGETIDALPEATVLREPCLEDELFDEVICDVEPVALISPPRARPDSAASSYPTHRDTLRPVRIVLLILLVVMIGAGATVAAFVV